MSAATVPIRIVAVCDDPAQLSLLQSQLAQEGFNVSVFDLAEKALESLKLQDPPPHLVITDLNMPGIDGWQFCRLLRSPEYAPLNSIPILIVSATYVGEDVRQICAASGADAFLAAPVEIQDLLRQIRDLLAGQARSAPSRVLVVEDESPVSSLLRDGLDANGYQVMVAPDSQTAQKLFAQERPDIVILDYHLPDANGDTLLQFFQKASPRPVTIMMTGNPDPNLAVAWMKQGAAAYIRKPFKTEYLVRLCANLLRERSLLHTQERLDERTRELRDSERRYRTVIDNIIDIIYSTDKQGYFIMASPAALGILGYSSLEEVIGRAFQEFWAQPERYVDLLDKIRQDGNVADYTTELRKKDGALVPVSISGSFVLDDCGEVIGLEGSIRDITRRKQAEEEKAKLQAQLFHAQKMESVGRLAGGVAHDFNNMLQVIQGNASMALEQSAQDSPVRECLAEILNAALRSAELTRQLLAFARKQPIQPRVLSLNDTVAATLKMLHRLIGEDVQLAWLPGNALWPILADPVQIDQILANLTINARDAIDGIGRITIETANTAVETAGRAAESEVVPGQYVLMSISDTGRGMSQEVLDHLFEPFFTTKEAGKGTGLGLATVFGIVKQNGGWIRVDSQTGQGATIKIYFPRAFQVIEPEPAATAAKPTRGAETLLLVEDEERLLTLTSRILRQYGYQVLAAHAPAEALSLAGQQNDGIHLLITDVVMPGMNGKQLWEKLQTQYPHLRCLFMSGYTAEVIIHNGVIDQGVNFLQKPFLMKVLAEKIREILDRP